MRRIIFLALTILFSVPLSAQFKKGPYIQELSSNSVRVIWETSTPSKGRLVYGLKGSIDRSIEESSTTSLHNILITGLLPYREYEYKVDGDPKSGYFTTFPQDVVLVKFVVYGDNRTNMADHQKIVDAIIKEKPLFVINTGDLVESGISANDWQRFFEIERELMRNICIFPTIGNNESIDPTLTLYKKYLFPPQQNSGRKEWYSFDIANIHIAVFNSYDGLLTFSNEQLKWIESDLAKASENPKIDHIFTVMHHGPYSASKHGDNPAAKSKVVPLLKKYGVDMTFAGHDHNYERGEASGLRYIVTGGGGAPLYSSGTSQYTIYSEKALHYLVLSVYGPDVSGCAYRVDGSVMDCFNWRKGRDIPDVGYEDIISSDLTLDLPLSDETLYTDIEQADDIYTDYFIQLDAQNDLDYDYIQDLIITDAYKKDTLVLDRSEPFDRRYDTPITPESSSGCNCLLIE